MQDLTQNELLYAASSSLAVYIRGQFPGYQFGAHHLRIIDALERVERGECRRLMIFMPPRHGKSLLVSEYFPAWWLGRNPTLGIIASSYALDLAEDFGRKIRNQLRDDYWQAVFRGRASLDVTSASATKICTQQGGHYYAVGVGGPITGRGADLLLIDDPVKNREEADSALQRKKLQDWYRSVAYTRLQRDAPVVIVQTRWHEDDLSGWILQEHGHEGWEVLSLPALDDQGNALWPEFFPAETLATIRSTLGTRDWTALYQQRPSPEEGAFFRREWFRFYDHAPALLRCYGASDYAVTADGGDYTVHLLAGLDEDDNLYVLDMWRAQTDALEWIDALVSLWRQYAPQIWAEEGGVILKSLDPLITKRQLEERLFSTHRRAFASAADKPTRARSLQGRLQMGKIFLPRPQDKPWVHDLVSEFLTFPQGRNDDMVDAAGLLCRMLDVMRAPKSPAAEPSLAERVQALAASKPTFNDLLRQSQQSKARVAGW